MTTCPESRHVQDYLDGELVPAERSAFEAHVATCAACHRELAVYRIVFERMAAIETWDPGPAFTERVLAEAMPRHSRWLPVLGWVAGGSLAASAAVITAGLLLPGPRAWIARLFAGVAHSFVASLLFALDSLNTATVKLVASVGATGAASVRLLALAHGLWRALAQPAVAISVWAAVIAVVALLWWMRPRESRAPEGETHVGLLGF